jgi:hypothetical protein
MLSRELNTKRRRALDAQARAVPVTVLKGAAEGVITAEAAALAPEVVVPTGKAALTALDLTAVLAPLLAARKGEARPALVLEAIARIGVIVQDEGRVAASPKAPALAASPLLRVGVQGGGKVRTDHVHTCRCNARWYKRILVLPLMEQPKPNHACLGARLVRARMGKAVANGTQTSVRTLQALGNASTTRNATSFTFVIPARLPRGKARPTSMRRHRRWGKPGARN